MASYQAPDTEFQAVANAIRTKGGTQAQLLWPTGFVNAIGAIPSGGGGGDIPSEYQQVQYLSVDGTQWAVVPLTLLNEDCISTQWMRTTQSGSEDAFMGVPDEAEFYVNVSTPSIWPVSTGKSYRLDKIATLTSNMVYSDSEFYMFVRVVLSDEDNEFWIGRYRSDLYPFVGRFYGMSVLRKEYGVYTIFRKYMPVYRKSDNIAGIFETETQQFYPSVGTGDFVAGPDVNSAS